MGGLLALLLVLLSPLAVASEPAPPVEVIGNGRLTAAIDATGRVAQLRWPTLGYWEHMGRDTSEEGTRGGAGWLLDEGEARYSFTAAEWHITHVRNTDGSLTTTYAARADDRRAVQHVMVLREMDVVVVRLELDGFQVPVKVHWYQHIAPSTRLVTGLADGYDRFPRSTGFVTAYDPIDGTMLAFRPKGPGKEDWSRARHLADSAHSSTAWSSFGDGVYWGSFSPSGTRGASCTPIDAQTLEVDARADEAVLPAVVGRAFGMMEPIVESTTAGILQVSLCLAVSASEQGLQSLRTQLLDMGVPRNSNLEPVSPGDSASLAARALQACVDPQSGSIVRAPISYPALAYATIFNTAWATAALDSLGMSAHGRRALEFHRTTLRTTYGSDGLPGSLPASVYSTGQSADLLNGANPSSTAWLLAALWRHLAVQESTAAEAQLQEWEEALRLAGDYLARAPVVGAVLSGTMKPAAATLADLQTHYLGLVSARLLLERLGEEEPTHWQQRREETYARIRFRQLDGAEEVESRWLYAWVRHLPEDAREPGEGWEILHFLEEVPVLLPPTIRGVSKGVPVSLRAALEVLDVPYTDSPR